MSSDVDRVPAAPSLARYFGRMWRYAPWLCLGHAVAWGLVNLTGLAPGVLVARYLNLIESGESKNDLVFIVLLVVGLAIFWFGLVLLGGYLEIQMRFRMSGLVRFNLLRTLLERYGADSLPYPVGQTISRFRDDGYAAEDMLDWSDEIILHTLFGIVALIALAAIDLWMTIAVTIPMIVVGLGTHLLGGRITSAREASSQATSEITGAIAGMLAATAAIKTAGAEQRVIERITALNDQRRAVMVRDAVATTVVSALSRRASGITTGIVMLIAADSIRSRELSVGDFALFVIWVGFLTTLTTELGNYLAFYRQAKVAFRRLNALLDGVPFERLSEHANLHLRDPIACLPATALAGSQPLNRLDVRELTCAHRSSAAESGVSGVTFSIERGSFTVITGRIGSGKSTLLRGLMGLLPLERGDLRWNGDAIADPQSFMTLPRVGYVPQAPRLFNTPLRENILFGADVEPGQIEAAIETAALDLDVAAFPQGLETLIGDRGLRLSGGQAMRAATARALVRDPDLVVLDDVTSALDVETERQFWDRLLADPDRTVLAVSHRRQAMLRADRIILLDGGRIVATGSLADLMATSAAFRELWITEDEDVQEIE